MKKTSKILMGASALLIAGSTFICSPKAEAAMSSWQTVQGIKGCEARVWTDATTYTRKATSIDVYAQTNGKCGTLNYRMGVTTLDGEYNIGNFSHKGSFSNKTPVKKFYFSKLLKPTFKERWHVNVELYKGGKMKDAVQSKTIYVEKRK